MRHDNFQEVQSQVRAVYRFCIQGKFGSGSDLCFLNRVSTDRSGGGSSFGTSVYKRGPEK